METTQNQLIRAILERLLSQRLNNPQTYPEKMGGIESLKNDASEIIKDPVWIPPRQVPYNGPRSGQEYLKQHSRRAYNA